MLFIAFCGSSSQAAGDGGLYERKFFARAEEIADLLQPYSKPGGQMNTPRIGSRNGRNCRGFTLIELMLVMVILVILASLVTPMLAKHSIRARIAAAKVDLRTYSTALSAFQMDCGRFPSNDEGLDALVTAPSDVSGWDGPYIEVLRSDPWGNGYIYQAPGTHFPTAFDLHSMGPDKVTEGDDIANWQ